jgi:hypothetical protein
MIELIYDKKLHKSLFVISPYIITDACRHLISKAKKEESKNDDEPWPVDSSIELFPVSGNRSDWKILLRRDGIKCYEKYGKENVKNQKKFIDYAKRVMKKEKKNSFKQQEDGSKQPNDRGTVRSGCSKFHRCKCKFFVCKQHCIKETNTYKAAVRCKGERIITISPLKHCNNEQWVQTTEAWEAVSQVIDYLEEKLRLKNLPIERIYISFGDWQSQANSLKPEDCHAHINLVLTILIAILKVSVGIYAS